MDFFNYNTKLSLQTGRLLISEPFLPDPNFERTIVLICENNDKGTLGFVLNNPSTVKAKDVMDSLSNYHSPLLIGGPVQQNTLHYIHRKTHLKDAVEVGNGVFWSGNFEQLVSELETGKINEKDIKFFFGYSGWERGQLEAELELNSWIVSDMASKDLIFDTKPELMWKNTLAKMGGRFLMYSKYPLDPRLN